MTAYLVLKSENGIDWTEGGAVDARSAKDAIRRMLDGGGKELETRSFVAVPVRSWKPVTVKVETKTALKFS